MEADLPYVVQKERAKQKILRVMAKLDSKEHLDAAEKCLEIFQARFVKYGDDQAERALRAALVIAKERMLLNPNLMPGSMNLQGQIPDVNS